MVRSRLNLAYRRRTGPSGRQTARTRTASSCPVIALSLLTVKFGVPIVVGLTVAFVFAAGCGSIMALITARLRGDYLAIVTLGFAEVVRIVASNEIWLTNGTDGISGIPGPWRGRISPQD